jgi:(E)-4-hydroxy-3-methylbut-2-enyl-diphosphate synthase
MLTSDTMDTAACVKETLGLAQAGCEIVRITAPTVKDARNLEAIRDTLHAAGCDVPLVADIHFKPEAALEAAKWVDKVRINPGNFADSKKFNVREYTDTEYAAEISRIRECFTPLVALCKTRGISMRIGTNHGSLSDRIMNRFGDTPLGMVESALEFARIARELDYHDFVFSMKASNPKVMIQAYRLLVARLDELEQTEGGDWNYPIHLGVTEAGDGEDGRIKSAIGIGSLLADGIGDTIRVSLTEDSEHEIPVAQALEKIAADRKPMPTLPAWPFDPFSYARRASSVLQVGEYQIGGTELVRVAVTQAAYDKVAHKIAGLGDYKPELIVENCGLVEIDPRDATAIARVNKSDAPVFVTIPDSCDLPVIGAYRLLASQVDAKHPILLKDTFAPSASTDFVHNLLNAATNIGSLLCDGIGDAVLVQGEEAPGQSLRIAYNILQAAGVRIFKTDYVACPSCGRTLFNLQETTARIKAATSHLKGVKIAIMGCIVNGPGEMADADFGYVGGAPGKVNLYVGKTPVKFNIPQAEAVDRLVDLIREHGRWVEPAGI